jgi:hypothetical protein
MQRLAGKTIGVSKSAGLQDVVIGGFINRYEFGLSV